MQLVQNQQQKLLLLKLLLLKLRLPALPNTLKKPTPNWIQDADMA
jgi:hypothetical protein